MRQTLLSKHQPKIWLLLAFILGFTVTGYSQIAPVVANATICSGSTARLTVTNTATGNNYFRWYKNANLTNLLQVGSSFVTPALNAAGTATTVNYYVVETNGTTNVNSTNVKTVAITVNPNPTAPTISAPTATCSGKRDTLTAILNPANPAGGAASWYSDAAGLARIGDGLTFITQPLTQATTFYVRETSTTGCMSSLKTVAISVNALPSAPASAGAHICTGSTALLKATNANASTTWFDNLAGTTVLGRGITFITPAVNANTSYWVANVSSQGCRSTFARAVVTIHSVPAAAALTPATPTVCAGSATTMTATGTGTAEWHIGAATNPTVFTGSVYTTNPLSSNTTYYVVMNNAGCRGTDASTAVTVNAIPATPTVAGAATCLGTRATLTATGATGTIKWFADATGTTTLGAGTSYTTPVLSQNTMYYAQQTVNGCASDIKIVPVTVNQLPSTPLVTTNPSACTGESVVLIATNITSNAVWYDNASATSADSVGTGSRFTTPALTASTSYFIQNVDAATGCKSPLVAAPININRAPIANAGGNRTIRYGETVQFYAAGGVTYKWSSPQTLDNPYVFNPTTTMALVPNTYSYSVTVSDENGCTASDALTLTVTPDPIDGSIVNVITPNGDGVNDEWELPFLYKFDSPYTLKIYARAGNEVYSTTSYDQKWNAKLNGADLPEGTYWYILAIEGDKKDYRGAITVKR